MKTKMMSLLALSVAVVILATGCAATKNNIHMDEKGYSNTGWQFGTPTIDTHTPGMQFRKPVMIPVPAGQQQLRQPVQPVQPQPSQDRQVQGAMVVPDVSSICPTCDVQVASAEWTGSAPQNIPQPVATQQNMQASEPQPQYLMAWEEGASQASPGDVIVYGGGGDWVNWEGGGGWFGGGHSSGWFGNSRGHNSHGWSVMGRGHSSNRLVAGRTNTRYSTQNSRSTCTTSRGRSSGRLGR